MWWAQIFLGLVFSMQPCSLHSTKQITHMHLCPDEHFAPNNVVLCWLLVRVVDIQLQTHWDVTSVTTLHQQMSISGTWLHNQQLNGYFWPWFVVVVCPFCTKVKGLGEREREGQWVCVIIQHPEQNLAALEQLFLRSNICWTRSLLCAQVFFREVCVQLSTS